MAEKYSLSRYSACLYLLLNSCYISGLVLFGTHTFLEVGWGIASLLAVVTFFVYLFVVGFAASLVNNFFGDIQYSYKSAILIASLLTVFVIPYTVFLTYFSSYPWTVAPSKYYFYTLVAAGIVFATTLIHGYVFKQTAVQGKRGLKTKFTLSLELVKTVLWMEVFFMLGTAYTQVLQATYIGSGEMFLIFYGSVGFIVFVIAPLMKGLADVLDQIDSGDT